ncbi:unnamed protein product [Protopolystoma xenopodis]|uniref:Uncharacterized protein n=1 Tax=Protopolystoma xenopodis TaxID=117903 RepID=A0A3S5CFL0_9PLAT|nr:unnamed protein product [Protopolystoma xenopodis]
MLVVFLQAPILKRPDNGVADSSNDLHQERRMSQSRTLVEVMAFSMLTSTIFNEVRSFLGQISDEDFSSSRPARIDRTTDRAGIQTERSNGDSREPNENEQHDSEDNDRHDEEQDQGQSGVHSRFMLPSLMSLLSSPARRSLLENRNNHDDDEEENGSNGPQDASANPNPIASNYGDSGADSGTDDDDLPDGRVNTARLTFGSNDLRLAESNGAISIQDRINYRYPFSRLASPSNEISLTSSTDSSSSSSSTNTTSPLSSTMTSTLSSLSSSNDS